MCVKGSVIQPIRKEIYDNFLDWMNLEGILLSKLNQSQKDKWCMVPLTCGTQSKSWTQKMECWLPGDGGGG